MADASFLEAEKLPCLPLTHLPVQAQLAYEFN